MSDAREARSELQARRVGESTARPEGAPSLGRGSERVIEVTWDVMVVAAKDSALLFIGELKGLVQGFLTTKDSKDLSRIIDGSLHERGAQQER